MANTPQKDSELIKDFIDLQKKEIEVRKNEVDFRGKDADNQKEVALRSIEAQESDLKDARRHRRDHSIITKLFIGFVILIVIALIVYLIEKGKDVLAIEILKIIGTAIIAFGGGFFYGKNKQAKESN